MLGVACAEQAYYNITSIESEQLSNAVRITVNADGAISYSYDSSNLIDYDLVMSQGRFTIDALKPTQKVKLHFYNARSQVGSFVQVGKYPVSHAELSIPPSGQSWFSLDVDINFYVPVRLWLDYVFSIDGVACGSNIRWFRILRSANKQSLTIIVSSDRMPQLSERLNPKDIPDTDRELRVGFAGGMLDIHARNARLSDLMQEVSRVTGREIMVDTATKRVVTAEIPYIAPDIFLERIVDCYSLVLNGTPERRVLGDMVAGTASAYTTCNMSQIPIRWLKAETARDLLPNFLLDYIRVDEDQNALIVTGSTALIEKIKTDLDVIDRPCKSIEIHATLIECSSLEELTRGLILDYTTDGRRLFTDSQKGQFVYSKLDSAQPGFDARLAYMITSQKAKVRADSCLNVLSGHMAELFAGVNKYVRFESTSDSYSNPAVEPVNAGTTVIIKPWIGSGDITMTIDTDVRNVDELDPITHLPVINTRSAQATFRVKPGDIVLIGGLSQAEVYRMAWKIPLLGDLPIVGGLFRKKVVQKNSSELILLIEAKSGPEFSEEEREKRG